MTTKRKALFSAVAVVAIIIVVSVLDMVAKST